MNFENKSQRRGFTLVELLVVISIIAIMLAILMPSLNKARELARRVQCSHDLRTNGLAMLLYADTNRGKLPVRINPKGCSAWLWDIDNATADLIMKSGGTRDTFYCPSNSNKKLINEFWTSFGTWRVTNYFWMTPFINSDGTVAPLFTKPPQGTGNKQWVTSTQMKNVSSMELASDAVMCDEGMKDSQHPYGHFTHIKAGVGRYYADARWFITNHTPGKSGAKCDGGNILFVDGHVKWRSFKDMERRVFTTPFDKPVFWW
ncbi:MAG: hypothetical protein A2Y10_04995 [Planctomycetes bacterium GWF2_41_51]|nr:MAG: hypothetical protein A2Y10_04995 [Planctomycetes bacterium GWF2_41_51]HBG25579.1 hypothetical protein [Phycisphaerales bacterium]